MKLSSSDLAKVLDQSNRAVLITDTNGKIVHVNDTFCLMTGYEREDVMGRSPSILQSKKTHPSVYQEMWRTISSGRPWSGRILNKKKPTLPMRIAGGNPAQEAQEYWAQLSITPIRNDAGEVYLFSAIHSDITQQVEIENMLNFDRVGSSVRAQIAEVLQSTQPLGDRLRKSLELLTSLDELHIENKGGVFVANEERTHLEMMTMHGEFPDEFVEREQSIPFGYCLCGRAAVSGEVLISDDCHCDDRHETRYPGMTAHGHYIVPLQIHGQTIGVMFLYTSVYPSRDECLIDMLKNVGHLMAQAIRNAQVDQRLIDASKAAETASKAKSEFLANMSHEIRTPLNGILGFTDMLLREDHRTTEENRKNWLSIIQNSGQHLLQLINNILDLSKVESREIELEMLQCDPSNILADLASIMRIHANDKMIMLNVENTGHLPRKITTDPTRLRQILTNLIGNAIKFTDQGSVTMRTRLDISPTNEGTLVIDVIDTGMGIPEDKLDSIFDPFSQADSSVTRNFGGTGLGLTISRKLAKVLGGDLTVTSTLGKGSTFTLTLGVGPVENLDIQHNARNESVEESRCPSSKSSITKQLNGRVLLVDDGETNRQLIGLILERAGAEVVTAVNGQEGYSKAIDSDFDLILMDMQMPVMDGYTTSICLREYGIKTPIIALTASAMAKDRERSMHAGCNEYLTKPVSVDKLIDRAAYWMNPNRIEHSETTLVQETSAPSAAPDTSVLVSTLPMDDPQLRKIVLFYIDTIPDQMSELENALSDRDFAKLGAITHKLIGSGGTVGFDQLSDAAIKLEEALVTKELDQISETIAEIRQITDRIERGAKEISAIESGSIE